MMGSMSLVFPLGFLRHSIQAPRSSGACTLPKRGIILHRMPESPPTMKNPVIESGYPLAFCLCQ